MIAAGTDGEEAGEDIGRQAYAAGDLVPSAGMARNDRTPDDEPQRRGRLFWICLLVLLMAAVWTVLKLVIDSESARTIIAIVAGGAFVYAFRDRIWGAEWREQLAAEREKQQRERDKRRR